MVESYSRTLVSTTAAILLIPRSVGVLARHSHCGARGERNRTAFSLGLNGSWLPINKSRFESVPGKKRTCHPSASPLALT
jgi:hypothetical protein